MTRMLRFGKATQYALYAAIELSEAGDGPVTVAEVAARYDVPSAVLAKVFQQLVRAGVANGTRGTGGGYRLARPASEVTVLDVIRVFESPAAARTLARDGKGGGDPKQPALGHLRRLLEEVDEFARCTFASVTLETLVARRRAGGAAGAARP